MTIEVALFLSLMYYLIIVLFIGSGVYILSNWIFKKKLSFAKSLYLVSFGWVLMGFWS